MRLAERHRINPKKPKETKAPSTVRIRKGGKEKALDVLYMNKGVYEGKSSQKDSVEDLIEKLNSEFNLKLKNDADSILLEIFKRGWKVNSIELGAERTYRVRFHRDVGGEKSRGYVKKAESIKKLLLLTLEHILNHENGRYEQRMNRLRRGRTR